jgi:hypothetical protein
MVRCAFIKQDGERCGATAMRGYPTCYGHRPDLAEQRRRNASKGGKSGGRGRPSAGDEVSWIRRMLREVVVDVSTGKMDRSRAAVAIQGLNALRGLLETEYRIKEAQEFEGRIAALEERLAEQGSKREHWAS